MNDSMLRTERGVMLNAFGEHPDQPDVSIADIMTGYSSGGSSGCPKNGRSLIPFRAVPLAM